MVPRLLALLCALVTVVASSPRTWELRPGSGCVEDGCCCAEVSSCCSEGEASGPSLSAGCGCGNHDPFVIHVSFEPMALEPTTGASVERRRPGGTRAPWARIDRERTAPEPPPPRRG